MHNCFRTETLPRLLPRLAGTLIVVLFSTSAPQRATAVVAPTQRTAESELKAIQDREAMALQDMSRWLSDTAAHDEHIAEKSPNYLSARMEHRIQTVGAAYDSFIAQHPEHAGAKALVATFRRDAAEALDRIRRWEDARAEAPHSPEPWNQLAQELIHEGELQEAFACFEKSVSLSPREASYFFDYATAILLYRGDAMSHYKLTEAELFDRVLTLYRRGLKLEPESYQRAADYAQTFYIVKPARHDEGLAAWEHAFKLAQDDPQRDEVRTHLARYAIHAKQPNLARSYLAQVTDSRLDRVKESLLRRSNEIGLHEKVAPAAR